MVWCDPDERSIPPLAERYGDRFLWASDFPHADDTPDCIPALAEMAAGFPSRRRRAFLGDQVRALFDVPDEARAAAAARRRPIRARLPSVPLTAWPGAPPGTG